MDAPLALRLQAFEDDVRALIPSFAETVDRMVANLDAAGVGESAPAVGKPMPAFLLPNQAGRLVALQTLLERGPVVVAFHRGQWCPYCRLSADALAKLEPEIKASRGQIVLVTPNLEAVNEELRSLSRGRFDVLTDLDNGYALSLNLAIRIPDDMRQMMVASGHDLTVKQGNGAWMLPIPATFVIGRDGMIKGRFVDPDFRRRMAREDIMAALQAA